MSMNEPGNPFQGLLGDLLKMMGGSPGGPTPWWESARALAVTVAGDGQAETNPDPLVRIRFEGLARVAELRVADATGLDIGAGGVTFTPVGRATFATKVLDAWRPLLDMMVAGQEAAAPELGSMDPEALDELGGGAFQDILGRLAVTMGPVLLGMQFGSAAGHLARRALGQYAVPTPWPRGNELLVVPENIAAFVDDWSLSAEEAELWVCLRELTTHAVLSQPHVAERFRTLFDASSHQAVDVQQGLASRLTEDLGNPEALQSLFSDPESLLGNLLTPDQRYTSAQLTSLVTALGAYVDHITAQIAGTLMSSSSALSEAWYRYRVEAGTGESAAAALFGLSIDREQVDRGAAFVRGVIERAGDRGLARLWESDWTLPTPAEVDAPGLWLERIDLPPVNGNPGAGGPEPGGPEPGGPEAGGPEPAGS